MPYKYCEKKYSLFEGCNTLQLGTFQYYRDMNPSFSIADIEEGWMQIKTRLSDSFEISFEKYNSIFGHVYSIDSNGSFNFNKDRSKSRLPAGKASHKAQGGNYIIDVNRNVLIFNSNIDFRIYYPESYIFCMSLDDEIGPRNPSEIDHRYDSCYRIIPTRFREFVNVLCWLLILNLKRKHIHSVEKPHNLSKKEFINGLECNVIVDNVDYVEEKHVYLCDADDFNEDRLRDIYYSSIFRKNKSKKSDNELRILITLHHDTLGYISVDKQPIILDLKPGLEYIRSLVE